MWGGCSLNVSLVESALSNWNVALVVVNVQEKKKRFTLILADHRRRWRKLGHAAMTVIGKSYTLSRYNVVRFGDLHKA